jgi:endonuclease IV
MCVCVSVSVSVCVCVCVCMLFFFGGCVGMCVLFLCIYVYLFSCAPTLLRIRVRTRTKLGNSHTLTLSLTHSLTLTAPLSLTPSLPLSLPGTYLVNLASPSEELRAKSRIRFLAELQRCEQLGINLYNIHPGSTRGEIPLEEGLQHIADGINWAATQTSSVKVVLENTAGGGNTIGRSFEELRDIIALVKDKNR